MVLRILEVAAQALWPAKYTTHIIVGLVTLYVMRTFSQGRRTNRERDLHARKVLVTVSSKFYSIETSKYTLFRVDSPQWDLRCCKPWLSVARI